MQNRKPLMFAAAAAIGLFGVVWLVSPGRTPAPPAGDALDAREVSGLEPVVKKPTEIRAAPDPSAAAAPSDAPPSKTPDDADASDRPPPASPAEEGLFALADASGESVVRCPLDAFPEGFQLEGGDVVVDGVLTRMVSPDSQESRSSFHVYTGDSPYMLSTTNAFPGTIGTCSVLPAGEDFEMQVSPEVYERLGSDADDASLASLDAADANMHPAQVALDDPDLSDGARAWLQDQLDATVDIGEAALERPTTNEEVLEAMDGTIVEPATE